MDVKEYDVIIAGGGAAGFFAAINLVHRNPSLRVVILERGNKVLTKVKISGGGRCNVAHAEYMPREMVKNYPRGEKELRGPFHRFMTADTIGWFEERGVHIKTEKDGRMFPVSDDSQTIIDCFLGECDRLGIEVLKKTGLTDFSRENGRWKANADLLRFSARQLVLACGSSTKIWDLLARAGHTIVSPVPSLFTFNIRDARISDLPGLATDATVYVVGSSGKKIIESNGPLLITHWGMSGPAVLKLSAWGARELAEMDYKFVIEVNWLGDRNGEEVRQHLKSLKKSHGQQSVVRSPQYGVPRRLWQNLTAHAGINFHENWADLSKKQWQRLAKELTECRFEVEGKSTFKEEFVTAGGVDLTEINFKTFESRVHPDLYLVGEILNIDAITGGFNFQNAWTGAFLAAQAIGQKYDAVGEVM